MYRFTFFSKKSLPLLRSLANVEGGNSLSLRNSFPLISGSSSQQILYRQISSGSDASSSNNVGDNNIGN
jgi:hypothetical protein